MKYLILILISFPCIGGQVYKSTNQIQYLSDIHQYPYQFMVETKAARSVMNAAQGFLAKNMAHFFYVSDYAISTQVNHGFINVSRIDLPDGWSEIEVVVSRHKTTRRGNVGVLTPETAVREVNDTPLGTVKLGTLTHHYFIDPTEYEVLATEFSYELTFGRLLVKFLITGVPYPSATFEEVLIDNLNLKEATEEEIKNGELKLVSTISLRSPDLDLLKVFTKVNSLKHKGVGYARTKMKGEKAAELELYKAK